MSQHPACLPSPKLNTEEPAGASSTYNPVSLYKPYKIRCYTHQDILEIGSAIHRQLVANLEAEKQRCIEETVTAVWSQAKLLKEEAVQKAFEQALEEQKNLVLEIEKEQELMVQAAVDKVKKDMKELLECELKKAHEDAVRITAEEIQKTLQRCNEEKTEAIANAKQQQRKIAFDVQVSMKKDFMQQHQEALELAVKKHQKSMQQLRDEKDIEIGLAVAVAQSEEQEKAKEMLKKQEINHQEQLEGLKEHLIRAQECQTLIKKQLESIVSSKEELEEELDETREAFQKYINVTFPQLAPGQADFILPFKRKMQEILKTKRICSDNL
ncbi:uncharacterized protein C6orf163 homolog [Discoglossus pictus]